MSEIRGLVLRMILFVDSDHSGNSVTLQSRPGFFFLNEAPIYWMSKKHTSCETSTFGRKFVAMNQDVRYVQGLHYKIRIFGIICEDTTFVYVNNHYVLANTGIPASKMKKKSNSVDPPFFTRRLCARWLEDYICENTWKTFRSNDKAPIFSGEKVVIC